MNEALISGLEPMTALTDAVLAAWTAFLAARIFDRANGKFPVTLWAWAFVATAVASLAGVAYHGARVLFSPAGMSLLWKIVPVATAAAATCMGVAAAICWLAPRARHVALVVLAIHLAVALAAAVSSDSFMVAAYAYVPVLIALLVGSLFYWREPSSRFMAAAVVVSFMAFAFQVSSIRIALMDHNDLFHIVQAVAMYLLYRGGVLLGAGESHPGAAPQTY